MPVEHGTNVGIAGVLAALARRIGDHDFGLFANVLVGFAEHDRIAVALGHFAAIEAGDPRRMREYFLRLFKLLLKLDNSLRRLVPDNEIEKARIHDVVPESFFDSSLLLGRIRYLTGRHQSRSQ